MQTVPEEIVERTWREMAQMPLQEVPRIIQRMEKEQPEILGFLLGIDYDIFNQDERELLLYLGVVIWQIMMQGRPRPKRVTAKRMDQIINRTDQMAEYLMSESEEGFEQTVEMIFKGHNQINVLRYAVEALFEMDDEEEQSGVREEMKGLIFMNLKTVIEALDQ
ncbi:MAG: hypothetical protein ONB44_01810 [candidate division KSB1 bacterium]|nr:hypothetical protein [candidate division KSB1 bacterium]MDZ7300857.1 hypothetical protein [candidate division KSB1 bacterium]MDZ7309873.1 hypothetical protein [candidate division KSB1 bacterium]